jgi:penicillin-insensitive murein endopeptidase
VRPITVGGLLFVAAASLIALPSGAVPEHHARATTARVVVMPERSVGSPNEGKLEGGAELEASDDLRIIPGHQNRWGLRELVGMLDRSSKRVAKRFPGSILSVGDLSRRGGGDVAGHHSHESGRDADVGFYYLTAGATNAQGNADPKSHGSHASQASHAKPFLAGSLLSVDEKGKVEGHSGVSFDDARNWALIEAWLTDPETRVNRVFVAEHLRARLLAYAKRNKVSSSLRARAAEVLFQPKGAAHDDHFHLRIGCPKSQKTCLEYVTREAPTNHRTAKSKPVIAKARKRVGTVGKAAPPMAGVVPAPNDFDDKDEDGDASDIDEGGLPRIAR